MASGTGYDSATTPSVAPFTKEQRQRLEAVTFARKLINMNGPDWVRSWIDLADYIVTGDKP